MPEAFLGDMDKEGHWDAAVLAHCIWYFTSPSILGSILRKLKGRVDRVCIAEYAMYATEKAAVPHVLAVVARGHLEAHKEVSSQNVRTPWSPRAIKEIAREAGWVVNNEDMLVPEVGLLDGSWEIGTVKSPRFLKEIEDHVQDERVKVVLETARDAVVTAVENLKGEKVRTMDVWVAAFEEAN
jgi:hypothetical protein